MANNKKYYRFKEAEDIRQTFSSWVNKLAYIGNGETNVLKRIIVKPKRNQQVDISEPVYSVKFEFVDQRKIDAYNFLINNGLRTVADDIQAEKKT